MPPLPSWLGIPFLDPVQGLDPGYILQANGAKNEPTTDLIRLGDRITDQAGKGTEYGILSTLRDPQAATLSSVH